MRIFITSTDEALGPYRSTARDVVSELGFDPVWVNGSGEAGPSRHVEEHLRKVEGADLLLAIVGWRLGPVPVPELGGDGLRSYIQLEVASAFRHAKPILVFMASENWPEGSWEDDADAMSRLRDFRGELYRLAVLFDSEPLATESATPAPGFGTRVRQELARHRRMADSGKSSASQDLRLRFRPPPQLPDRPYPLLLPYTHPDLWAGREREMGELRRLLRLPVPILGLYAPSGAGKSSLLTAGLTPALRAAGQPVALERQPAEPGLARRLISDLVASEGPGAGAFQVSERDPRVFVDLLLEVGRSNDKAPILVLDQFEDVLRGPVTVARRKRHDRAVVGSLLAASIQRQPGFDGPPCRWVLAYRQEYHGEVVAWLADVLREARAENPAVDSLPHDLSTLERFHSWPLPPLGTPPPRSDRVSEATRAFQAAIETPLALRTSKGSQQYPWRFSGDGARRLARAFGEARAERPDAPLTPELQVVLAHLLERAERSADGTYVIEVPEDPGTLISEALEEHLRRALANAFPFDPESDPSKAAARQGRARALLALRELADSAGRRAQHLALLEEIELGDPDTALAAMARLVGNPRVDHGELRSRLRQREKPMDLLELGLAGVSPENRAGVAVRGQRRAGGVPRRHGAPHAPEGSRGPIRRCRSS